MKAAVNPADDEQIAISIARHLLVRSPIATILSLLFAILTVTLLNYIEPTRYSGVWVASVAAVNCLPFVYIAIQRRHPFNTRNIRKYLLLNTFNALASGLVWGSGMVVLTNVTQNFSIGISFIVIFAYSTAAIVSHGAFPRSYAAAAGTASLIYGIYLIAAAPSPQSNFGFAIILMFVFYFVIAKNFSRVTIANLVTQQQNRTMMEELKAQRDAIEKSNEDKTRFLAATSHDLAQPLHAQGNYITALRGKLNRPEQHELLEKVEASWRSMGHMLDGLVDISKLESGAVATDTGRVELSGLVSDVFDEFKQVADEKQIRLTVNSETCFADTDPYLFSRIVRNVLSNAIKFTPSGGEVTATVGTNSGRIDVAISDTGIGIPAQSHAEIFEEYVQLHNPERDRQKGLGLGLSIVRRLCDLLTIEFRLQSEPSKGTVFTFSVPKAENQDADLAPTTEEVAALRMSALVIDDERAILDSMSVVLSDWGCEVYCAHSEEEAIGLIRTLDLRPEIVIADLRLRDHASGLDAIAQIRSMLGEDVPAVVMTGNVDRLGGDTLPPHSVLLAKPVEATTLYREIKKLRADTAPPAGAEPAEVQSGATRF